MLMLEQNAFSAIFLRQANVSAIPVSRSFIQESALMENANTRSRHIAAQSCAIMVNASLIATRLFVMSLQQTIATAQESLSNMTRLAFAQMAGVFTVTK
jgi:hypothetical protein